jgi:hypothetical protein
MTCFHDLPNELLFQIIEFLESDSPFYLWAASLTSKSFYHFANPLLYRTLKVYLPQTCSSVPPRVPLLLRTLLTRPDLGALARSLSVVCTGVMGSRDLLVLVQQQRILEKWRGHLLDLERVILEEETKQAKAVLLQFSATSENQSGHFESYKPSTTRENALRLYGTVDGSISYAIAGRLDEVLDICKRVELKISEQYAGSNKYSFVDRFDHEPKDNLGCDVQTIDEDEYTNIMEQALLNIRIDDLVETPGGISEEVLLSVLPEMVVSMLPNVAAVSLDLPASARVPKTSSQPGLFPQKNDTGFRVLTSLTIGYSTGISVEFEDVAALLALPCLRAIEVHGCQDFPFRGTIDEKSSSVTSLKLIQSDLAPKKVKMFIRACKKIEVFEYTHMYKTRKHARIRPSQLVHYLRQHSEHLHSFSSDTPDDISGLLDGSDLQERRVGLFGELESLTNLDVCNGALILHPKEEQDEPSSHDNIKLLPQLYAALPRSLIHLTMRHCHEEGTRTTSKQLLDILVRKESFPDLRIITVTSPSFMFLDVLMVLREQFHARGVQLICDVCEPSRVRTILNFKSVIMLPLLTLILELRALSHQRGRNPLSNLPKDRLWIWSSRLEAFASLRLSGC